tara:strand:+ start:8049 stop:8648 length:600 start_codon:yes stop_codon:yes gene_type:complete
VKFLQTIPLFGLLFILTACPPSANRSSPIEQIKNNGMDLPDLQPKSYNGIIFELSSLFELDYTKQYVLTDYASTHVIYMMDLNFSVEYFDNDDAGYYQYSFEEDIELLDAVHDNYILKRQASLEEYDVTIKKPVPKEVGFPGYIQVVHGSANSYSESSSYFTATLQVGKEFFVFQMIGKQENMGYLYDDFIDLLASVRI